MNPPNYLPLLRDIFYFLRYIAHEVGTNLNFCLRAKEQLKECGYDWFDDISDERVKEQVMKVFAVAVNEAIQKKVDLTGNENPSVVNQELHQLLGIDDQKLRNRFLDVPLWNERLVNEKSPLDMADYLKKDAPQWLAKKMIEHQFDIRWNTPTGEPDDYTFYQFCDKAEKTTKPKDFKFFKYDPRQAHVKATLYKECRSKRVHYLQSITKKEELCPIVYVLTTRGWKSWQANKTDKFNQVSSMDFPDWINTSILKFIAENADEQVGNRKDILAKPTLYWVVVNDRDFEPGNKLKLKSIGQTQVYVGKANNGIQGRWITDGKSHCEMIKKCLDNVCAMTTYDPLRLEGIQLVDARLALAKVRGEKTALFVIKTFGDAVEKAEIALQKAQVRLDKAQRDVDRATAHSRTQTAYPCIPQGPVTMPYQYNPPRPVTMPYQYNPAGPITMPPQYNPAGSCAMPHQYIPPGPFTMPHQYNPAGSFTMPHQYIPPVYPIMTQTSPLNTTSSRESSRLQELEAEVEERQEELDESTAVDNDPKTLTIRKAKAETQLTQAEKQHRKGKRVHEHWKNIIPYKDYQISWKPTDMGYGMNCH